jgi:hypothetical protein
MTLLRRPLALAAPLAAVAALSCGGGRSSGGRGPSTAGFECLSRRAEYMVVGGLAAPEAGVSLECDRGRPRITRWTSDGGSREVVRSTHPLSPEQFERAWERIDSTGWRFLARTCPGAAPPRRRARGASNGPRQGARWGTPVYTIDVADSGSSVSLTCAAADPPFPYDRLVNELDLRAAGFGDDAGSPH